MNEHREGDCAPAIVGSVTGYSRYIGRVGALAVALGIGVAVATTPGTAWATPDPGSPAADGSTSSPPEHDATTDDTPDTGTLSTDYTPTPTGSNPAAKSPTATPVKPDPRDGIVQASGGLNTTVGEPTTEPKKGSEHDTPGLPAVADLGAPSALPKPSGKNTAAPPLTTPTAIAFTAQTPAPLARTVFSPPKLDTVSPTLDAAPLAFEALVETENARPSTALVAPSPIPPAQVQPQVHPIAAIVGPFVSLATGLFVLGPALIANPLAPLDPTFAWVVLAAVRRQFEQTLFNQSPSFTYGAIDTSQSDTSVVTGTVAATDPNDDPLGYRIVDGPANGAVTIDPTTGQFNYIPDAELAASGGTDTFTVAASELNTTAHFHRGPIAGILAALTGADRGDTAVASVTVTVLNDPPDAVDDIANATEDTPTVLDVLANDTDVEGDPITITTVSAPASGGTAVANADGDIDYTPGTNYNGTDTFTYTVNGGDTATVTVAVAAVDDPAVANDDTASTDEDTAATIDVLANDTDPDNEPITITNVSTPASGGTAVANADGDIDYTPGADFNGEDTFSYTVNGGDTATVTVTVNPVDDAPDAVNDTAGTDEDTAITIDVLANDTDVEGDPITITTVSAPASGGTAVANADGDIDYTPGTNYNGTDTFTYTVNGGDTATVSVNVAAVNDAPTANPTVGDPDLVTGEVTGSVGGADVDDATSTLTYQVTDDVDNGTLTLNADGTFTYTPTQAARLKAGLTPDDTTDDVDTFTVTVSDPHGATSAPTTITVPIDPAEAVVTASIPIPGGVLTSTAAQEIGVNPDGTRVYFQGSGVVKVLDTGTNTFLADIPAGKQEFSPDGSLTYRLSGQIEVIDTATGTVLKSFTIPDTGFASDFVISPDGETAYVVARPQIVHVIDITDSDSTTTDVVATISLADDGLTNFNRMAINADGSRVYVTAFTSPSGPPVTVVIDTTDNSFTTVAVGDGLNNLSRDVVVSPDGTRVYVLRPVTLEVIDADTNTRIDSIALGTNSAADATFSPDGSLIYLSEQTAGGRIVVVDTATGTVLTTIDLTTIDPNNSPLGVQFTADGRAYTVGVVGSFGNASVSEISIVSTTPPVV